MNDKAFVDLFSSSASNADHRAAVRRAEEERALERQRALDSQFAFDLTPQERIRTWERLHALPLPSGAAHPLIAVIAAHTRLTVGDVRDEQQRRRRVSETVVPAGAP